MKNRLSLMQFLLCLCGMAVAQNETPPGWLTNTPKADNSTYVYVVERASGSNVNEAVNNAILKVLRTTMMRIGAVVSWDEVNNSLQNGADWGSVAMKYNIPVNKVCEYVISRSEKGALVAILCQVAKSGAVYPDFDEFNACKDTKKYSDGGALLKSMFIPGLGQIGKRHYGSGIFTLLFEAAFLGGAAGSYFMAQDELATMKNYDVTLRAYNSAKHNYETYRIVNLSCLGAAGVFYVYNLIRAYTMTPKYQNLAFEPTLIQTNDGLAAGANITLKF